MFRRLTIAALLLSTCIGVAHPAFAQIGEFPGVTPPLSSPQLVQPPIVYSPNLNGPSTSGPSVVPLRSGPPVLVPSRSPGPGGFSDRVETCIQAGTAAGLGPNAVARFSGRCAN
jgi:hypothetical protein